MRRLKAEKDIYAWHKKMICVNESVIMMGKWMVQERDKNFQWNYPRLFGSVIDPRKGSESEFKSKNGSR